MMKTAEKPSKAKAVQFVVWMYRGTDYSNRKARVATYEFESDAERAAFIRGLNTAVQENAAFVLMPSEQSAKDFALGYER